MSSLQIGLLVAGGVTLLAVVLYNQWVSRRSAPRQAENAEPVVASEPEPLTEPSAPVEPVLEDDFRNLPQPERRPVLDALIDVISTIEVDQPVSGDAALAALPSTRRVGTKPFHVEGCSELSGEWEPLMPGRRYSAFQAGVQLANRMGLSTRSNFPNTWSKPKPLPTRSAARPASATCSKRWPAHASLTSLPAATMRS